MSITITDKSLAAELNRNLNQAQTEEANAISKLSSGIRFTDKEPAPSERAMADSMEYRLRALNASKKNINDGFSMLQTADGAMQSVHNMLTRMKELNISAATSTMNNTERRYIFVEYEALHDEINRIANTTEFNGVPLLHGSGDNRPDEWVLRLDDPYISKQFEDMGDINTIKMTGMKSIDVSTANLGIKSARDLLLASSSEEGIELEAVQDLMSADDQEKFATTYDRGLSMLSDQRALLGAVTARLGQAKDFVDVYQENIAAAKSRIADTDYAAESAKLMQARLQVSATTALMAQSNFSLKQSIQLLTS